MWPQNNQMSTTSVFSARPGNSQSTATSTMYPSEKLKFRSVVVTQNLSWELWWPKTQVENTDGRWCPKMTLNHRSLPAITIVCDISRPSLAIMPLWYHDSLSLSLQAKTILPQWHSWQASFRVLAQGPGWQRMSDPQLQRSHVSRHAIKLAVTQQVHGILSKLRMYRAHIFLVVNNIQVK